MKPIRKPAVSSRQPNRRAQNGQATTELAILAAVLVPLFLLIPVLAKYIHLRQTNHQAARAAAWDATVSPDYRLPDQPRTQTLLIERHFARSDAPIRSDPTLPPRDSLLGNVFLNTFSNQPLLKRADIRLSAYQNRRRPGFMDDMTGFFEGLPGEFPPNDKGYITAEVTLSPQNLRTANGQPAAYLAPFDAFNLVMTSRQTLLADAWNAAGPGYGRNPHDRSVITQVCTLALACNLKFDPGLSSAIEKIPFVGVIGRLEVGQIKPDIVPYERLHNAPRR